MLLDLLREQLGLTGTKQSCDRKGQCGACTVIVDGKATRSCLKKVVDLEGADVITVEGLGTPENPHLIQEAFVLIRRYPVRLLHAGHDYGYQSPARPEPEP